MAVNKPQILPWSGTNFFAITPSDSSDLVQIPRGIYVGGSGDLAVHDLDGDAVTFTNLAAGVVHPISAKKVLSTGTTATGIIGIT